MQKNEIIIAMPEIASSSQYRGNVKQIVQLVHSLNNYTDNLEEKVNSILKGQQTQFVNSYRNHMNKVENTLKQFQKKIEEYQKKISYYENQGVFASLIKKIQFLENYQKKLLNNIQEKGSTIKLLKQQIRLQSKQIKNLQQFIKKLRREAATNLEPIKEKNSQADHQMTFATEILHSQRHLTYQSSQRKSLNKSTQINVSYERLENPQSQIRQDNSKRFRIENQIEYLKKKNREAFAVNAKLIQKNRQIEQFFGKIVSEFQKKISNQNQKRVEFCTLEQFKQSDKLELLIKLLSNEELLGYLYEKIFKQPTNINMSNLETKDMPKKIKQFEQKNISEKLRDISARKRVGSQQGRFPAIKSARKY